MASTSDTETLEKIAELKADISAVNTTLNTHVKSGNQLTDGEFEKGKKEIVDAVKKGKDEQKTRWEALMEALHLKEIFEAFKQLDTFTVVIIFVGATLALLKDRVLNYGKLLNLLVEKVTGKIVSVDPQRGTPAFQTREATEAGQAVSINPTNVTPERLSALQSALNTLTPEVNSYNSEIRAMKSPAQIKKIAKAVGDLKAKLTPNPAEDIKEVATAIGELNGKLQHYDPEKLPKPQAFKKIADAAKDLNRDAGTLRQTFLELATASNTAAGAIGGGATAPAAR
ncbi:hypothetical protein OG252_21810 [Streptomyces sp. NBC_01352]|uniref:hypothetical protein n=1 Tax=Streptomyces sp. NBC_01352 TaxID=2903834 RepID=UPI002E34B6B1|nr:hypothetical protein [Streptomyces sp. NBC_01352]